jgi:hypothetical protein
MTTVWNTSADGPINWPATPGGANARVWNTIKFRGNELPGLARVTGIGRGYDLQIKKSAGMDGSTVTDLGRGLGKFTVTLILSCQADLDGFEKVLKNENLMLQPLVKNKLTDTFELAAVSVTHPLLNLYGINSCKVEEITIPKPGSAIGTFEVELKCLEHRPAKAMPGSGTAHKDVRTAAGGKFFPWSWQAHGNNSIFPWAASLAGVDTGQQSVQSLPKVDSGPG